MSHITIISRLIVFILIDIIAILLFVPLGLLYLSFGKQQYDNGNPLVVLIHGSGVNDIQWNVAKAYLYFSDISFISVNYNYSQSITKSANNVLKLIPKDRDIILIGHFQGGLISRYIANNINTHQIYLMNTPQKGAIILNFLYPNENICANIDDSQKDMRYGSDFIKNLPIINDNIKVFEIVGINDFVRDIHSIEYEKNVYKSWFGHYFSAVNPYLWFNYIIPNIKNEI